MIAQYNRLSRPPAPPAANLQLSLPLPPLAAPARNLWLAPTAPHSGSTEGRLPRLGSVWLRSARPVADLRLASGVPRFRSTDGDPSGSRRTTLPPARPAISADSHRILILQLGWSNNLRLSPFVVAASSLRLPLPQLPACTGCCPHSRQTGGELPTRIGCSTFRLYQFRFTRLAPCVSTSGWAFDAPLTSAEPCIGS